MIENNYYANPNHKKFGVTMLTSDIVNFKTRALIAEPKRGPLL